MSRYRADVEARRSIDVDRASVDRVAHQAVRGLTVGWIAALRIATTPTRCDMLGLPVHVR
jgi:hypothetical protein